MKSWDRNFNILLIKKFTNSRCTRTISSIKICRLVRNLSSPNFYQFGSGKALKRTVEPYLNVGKQWNDILCNKSNYWSMQWTITSPRVSTLDRVRETFPALSLSPNFFHVGLKALKATVLDGRGRQGIAALARCLIKFCQHLISIG